LYLLGQAVQPCDTSINAEVKTTNIIPVDSAVANYNTYSQTQYEKTFINQEHYFNNQKDNIF